jgi:hypothetical protein
MSQRLNFWEYAMKRRDFLKATAALALPATAMGVPRVRVENVTPVARTFSSTAVQRVEFYPQTAKSFVLAPDSEFKVTWEYSQPVTRFYDEETGEVYFTDGRPSGWLRLEMSLQKYVTHMRDVELACDVTMPCTIRIAGCDSQPTGLVATLRNAVLTEMNPWHDDDRKPYYAFVFSKLELGRGAIKCFS